MPPFSAPSPHAARPSVPPADLPWVLHLAGSPERGRERAATVVSGTTAGLAVLAAALWLYDLVLLTGG